ncbi:phosphate ABC transporter permease PstA [Nocardioides sp. SYSU DS0651]|uniref:phosphate ABC transporter permease PstA n=1 Tax=Nocardioides sp. SYSU DS0651 TaxID=3415955 RepID=UPI003F4BDF7D
MTEQLSDPRLDELDGTPPGSLLADPDARRGTLPRFAVVLVAAVALAAGGLVAVLTGRGLATTVIVAWLVLMIAYPAWTAVVEGRRSAVDHAMGALMWTAFVLAMIPLVSLVVTVVVRGAPVLTPDFLTSDMTGRALLGEGGGIAHAIAGTFLVTLIAALIAVPVGLLTAIWLVEYGEGSKLASIITFLVDVMTGIPSIVAGLFAVAFFQVVTGDDLPRLGIGGGVALSLLMLPTVIRAVEEMLKLVPADLREASYALGVPKWRTIIKVVLPTAVAGIVTGVTLAIARVAGETAPLLLILGTARATNWNPFDGAVQTLPVFIFQSLSQTSHFKYGEIWFDRVWGAALVLILIVMTLNVAARLVGSFFAPKSGK